MKEIYVSIIIVKYKSEKYLEDCIESIKTSLRKNKILHFAQKDKDSNNEVEIIVVDNDKENIGYGAGLNKGARIAKGKYLLLLNPDTIILDNAIKEMLTFLENHPEVAILGPRIFNNQNRDKQLSFCRFPGPLMALFVYSPLKNTFLGKMFWRRFTYNENYGRKGFLDFVTHQAVHHSARNDDVDKIMEVDEVSGAAMMIRKSVFEKIHGFDKNIFMYFEENDLCRRVQTLGYKIYFDPKAEIIHYGGKSSTDIETSNNYFRKSRNYFFKKHFGMIIGNKLNFLISFMEFFIRIRKTDK